jgi:hypothetical protein
MTRVIQPALGDVPGADLATSAGTLRAERRYQRVDVTRVTGITAAHRTALLALAAVEPEGSIEKPAVPPKTTQH